MKLLTLNTHSIIEENYEQKFKIFVDEIYKERPDIIALQEVNQSADYPLAYCGSEFVPCSGNRPVVKSDNHALRTISALKERGLKYYWTWLGIKNGYEKFDEGIAFLSLKPIDKTNSLLISRSSDYSNWKTRKALGILVDGIWFYNTHMGWWSDENEPFEYQWHVLNSHLKTHDKVWVMGDFNSPSQIHGEGYTLIKNSGYFDSYDAAQKKDDGITVTGKIDGWGENPFGVRIDQIWSRFATNVKSSQVVFKDKKTVSDHFGVMIEI